MRIRTDTKGRDETLRRLMQASGESTKTAALFTAARHYLRDKQLKERYIQELYGIQVRHPTTGEECSLIEAMSTDELPMTLDVDMQVGHDESE